LVVTIDKLNQLSIHLEYTGKQILIQYLVSYHAVEPLHHSICPWTVKLDRTVGDVVLAADLIKGMDLVRVAVFRRRAACILANKREYLGKKGDRLLLGYANVKGESWLSPFPARNAMTMHKMQK